MKYSLDDQNLIDSLADQVADQLENLILDPHAELTEYGTVHRFMISRPKESIANHFNKNTLKIAIRTPATDSNPYFEHSDDPAGDIQFSDIFCEEADKISENKLKILGFEDIDLELRENIDGIETAFATANHKIAFKALTIICEKYPQIKGSDFDIG